MWNRNCTIHVAARLHFSDSHDQDTEYCSLVSSVSHNPPTPPTLLKCILRFCVGQQTGAKLKYHILGLSNTLVMGCLITEPLSSCRLMMLAMSPYTIHQGNTLHSAGPTNRKLIDPSQRQDPDVALGPSMRLPLSRDYWKALDWLNYPSFRYLVANNGTHLRWQALYVVRLAVDPTARHSDRSIMLSRIWYGQYSSLKTHLTRITMIAVKKMFLTCLSLVQDAQSDALIYYPSPRSASRRLFCL